MSALISNFERELLEKIRQKSKSRESMDSFLCKAFRFFDLGSNGRLSRGDFFRAVAKCGVVVQPSDLQTVFEHYSSDSDSIDYHDFVEQIVYREEEIDSNSSRLKMANSQKSHVLAASKLQEEKGPSRQEERGRGEQRPQSRVVPQLRTYDEVLGFIKSSIRSEGLGSLLRLSVRLKATDREKSHLVDRSTLTQNLPFLSKDHLSLILGELSQDGSHLDYSVLIYDLKGQLDEETVRQIDRAFALIDIRREGEFPIEYLLSRFQSRTLEEEFRQAVELYAKFQGIDDGTFTEDDCNDFLGFLSFDFATLPDFTLAIIRPFEQDNRSSNSQRSTRTRDFQLNQSQKGMPEGDFRKDKQQKQQQQQEEEEEEEEARSEKLDQDDKKSVSRYSQFQGHQLVSSNKLKVFESVILRIKRRLASKGTRGFLQLERALKQADIDHDTLLTPDEFTQVIKAQRIDITPTQCASVYQLFDNEGTGLISFAELMFTLRGNIPEARREMAQKLWGQVRNTDDSTSFSRLRHLLSFRSHPDVQTGRRHEDDIWKEIQETILTIQELNGVPRSDTVSSSEFEEYMENLSLSVADDRLFQSILLNFWRLDNSASILEKYAGSRKLFDHAKNGYLMDHHRNYVNGGSVSQNAPFGTSHDPTSYVTEHRRL